VTTVAPLASDPAIQQAIADQVTAQVLTYLDVPGLTNQLVDALAERGLTPLLATQLRTLSGPIASGVEGFTHDQVVRVVQSDAFADAWTQANRVAHNERGQACSSSSGGSGSRRTSTSSRPRAWMRSSSPYRAAWSRTGPWITVSTGSTDARMPSKAAISESLRRPLTRIS